MRAMADPGFPVGGMDLIGRTWTPEEVTFPKFCISKTKESGSLGWACTRHILDPPMERTPQGTLD